MHESWVLYLQVVSQFRGHRHFPVVILEDEDSHSRQVRRADSKSVPGSLAGPVSMG